MVTILGYVAYAFICFFNPLQLFSMVRRRNINLGAWPLVSLTLGLALLELSFLWVTAPMYVVIGTAVSLTFTAINLMQVLYAQRGTNPRRNAGKIENFAAAMSLDEGPKQGPPLLYIDSFADCKTCGCLLLREQTRPVEVRVYDVAFSIAREHKNLPELEHLIHLVRVDHYCKRDRPAYDEAVFYPSAVDGGSTSVEFFRWVAVPWLNGTVRVQVNEDGSNYD